jgi:hypothetical protein
MAGYDIVLPIWIHFLLGGFNPSEKYESQIGSSSQLLGKKHMFLGWLFPIYGKS